MEKKAFILLIYFLLKNSKILIIICF